MIFMIGTLIWVIFWFLYHVFEKNTLALISVVGLLLMIISVLMFLQKYLP